MKNVKRKQCYNQVCVWSGMLIERGLEKEFEKFILEKFDTRAQFLETITTLPNTEGEDSLESGGRLDVFFAVHEDDVVKFAIKRLAFGIRWIEDVLSNMNEYYKNPIYPNRVMEYKSWDIPEEEVEDESLE